MERGSKPLKYVSEDHLSANPIFAFVLEWPENNILILGEPTNGTEYSKVIMLGTSEDQPFLDIEWTPIQPQGIAIEMPNIPVSLLPHHLVWTLALYGFD